LIDLFSKINAFDQLDASRFLFHTNFSLAWGLNLRLVMEIKRQPTIIFNAYDQLAGNAL
jgi:hypothetical protein